MVNELNVEKEREKGKSLGNCLAWMFGWRLYCLRIRRSEKHQNNGEQTEGRGNFRWVPFSDMLNSVWNEYITDPMFELGRHAKVIEV